MNQSYDRCPTRKSHVRRWASTGSIAPNSRKANIDARIVIRYASILVQLLYHRREDIRKQCNMDAWYGEQEVDSIS